MKLFWGWEEGMRTRAENGRGANQHLTNTCLSSINFYAPGSNVMLPSPNLPHLIPKTTL